MAWYSVLPSHLTVYETWIIRTFIILAVVNMAPWIVLIVYDFLLYLFRMVYHEIPVLGGRARGQLRPRAPSLVDRNRRMSMAELITGSSPRQSDESMNDQSRKRGYRLSREDDYAIEEEADNT